MQAFVNEAYPFSGYSSAASYYRETNPSNLFTHNGHLACLLHSIIHHSAIVNFVVVVSSSSRPRHPRHSQPHVAEAPGSAAEVPGSVAEAPRSAAEAPCTTAEDF
jgi:hypothetical protein